MFNSSNEVSAGTSKPSVDLDDIVKFSTTFDPWNPSEQNIYSIIHYYDKCRKQWDKHLAKDIKKCGKEEVFLNTISVQLRLILDQWRIHKVYEDAIVKSVRRQLELSTERAFDYEGISRTEPTRFYPEYNSGHGTAESSASAAARTAEESQERAAGEGSPQTAKHASGDEHALECARVARRRSMGAGAVVGAVISDIAAMHDDGLSKNQFW